MSESSTDWSHSIAGADGEPCAVCLCAAEQDMSTERSATDVCGCLHPGWNLGNTFDAPGGETAWGNPKTTKELIDAIAACFRSIRIGHLGPPIGSAQIIDRSGFHGAPLSS